MDNEQILMHPKPKPNEWQFRQRAYPIGSLDQTAYLKALKFRKQKLSQKESPSQDRLNSNPWEFAGPINVGGRITDLEITTAARQSLYVGSASGGIFRTQDMGTTWTSIFDESLSLSIGDMALAPSNQKIIYVGTGEANAGGGSLAYDGNGIYRSDDGGNTWSHLGLDSIGSVGKVVVHPVDPEIAYIAAMGYLFENNSSRGVYKTLDGGQTWEKALYINDSTGMADLAIHPKHPDTIYAASWERVRRPSRRSYGGGSSGIHRSLDGGFTWQKLTTGLPETAGRIGITISESNPEILYTIIANEITGKIKGVYKTLDHGDSWESLNILGISNVSFMWWFGKIFVDPIDPDIVYIPSLNMSRSTDGGNSWGKVFDGAHVDQHSLLVNPINSNMVFAGNDGGLYISQNKGDDFTKINGLPITQFYTCALDYSFPERLYGGTQDNGTVRTMGGELNDWERIYGGDGFYALIDPEDNSFVYAESQYGNLGRSTDGGSSFFNGTSGISPTDRTNWNTPVIFNPNDPTKLYYGSNRLYRSDNRAAFWTAISPDLTGNPQSGNLVYGTITSIDVSPLDDNIIIVGTDDGNVQVTQDGGNNWTEVSTDLPTRWVTNVVTDPFESNTAYVTLSGYRHGTQMGHIYKTNDLGENWTDISGNLPDIPVNDLIVIPDDGHIYIATDIGVYYSSDGGTNWDIAGIDLPNVVVTQLTYHQPTNSMIAGTYGRGMHRLSLEEIVSTENEQQTIPLDIKAYPNPFADRLVIEFENAKRQLIQIQIIDMTAHQHTTLFKGNLDTGNHALRFNVENLKDGVYSCVVTSDDQQIIGHEKLLRIGNAN
jgi:photosystem II stability/assembly factor-like uncharacterized protein